MVGSGLRYLNIPEYGSLEWSGGEYTPCSRVAEDGDPFPPHPLQLAYSHGMKAVLEKRSVTSSQVKWLAI
jgi:hypothetical protein